MKLYSLAALLATALPALAQTAPNDIPKTFTIPTADYDYVKREVMIPMRDGVKLYTVIVVPKGAQQRADPADPHALQRLQAHRAQRQPAHARDPAAGRRSVRRRRLHPRLSGRARQVQIRRRLRDDAAGARPAELHRDRPRHRCLRHHRLAGEEHAGIERPRRHDRLVLRRLHGGDGAARSASGA